MQYELFSYPNCNKCDEIRRYLEGKNIKGSEYSLTSQDSLKKIRDYSVNPNVREKIKRDKGAIILPLVLLLEEGEIKEVIQTKEDLEACLSKD